MSFTTFTKAARIRMARLVKESGSVFLGLGAGQVGWGDNPPNTVPGATAMVAPLCYRKILVCEYAELDNVNGDIVMPNGDKYKITLTPTDTLYFRGVVELDEGAAFTYREMAVFFETTTQAGLPGGQLFFTPAQVTNPGTMVLIQNRTPVLRNAETRETFHAIATF